MSFISNLCFHSFPSVFHLFCMLLIHLVCAFLTLCRPPFSSSWPASNLYISLFTLSPSLLSFLSFITVNLSPCLVAPCPFSSCITVSLQLLLTLSSPPLNCWSYIGCVFAYRPVFVLLSMFTWRVKVEFSWSLWVCCSQRWKQTRRRCSLKWDGCYEGGSRSNGTGSCVREFYFMSNFAFNCFLWVRS